MDYKKKYLKYKLKYLTAKKLYGGMEPSVRVWVKDGPIYDELTVAGEELSSIIKNPNSTPEAKNSAREKYNLKKLDVLKTRISQDDIKNLLFDVKHAEGYLTFEELFDRRAQKVKKDPLSQEAQVILNFFHDELDNLEIPLVYEGLQAHSQLIKIKYLE